MNPSRLTLAALGVHFGTSRSSRTAYCRYMIVDTYPDSRASTARADIDPIVPRHATCPLCHTTNASLSDEALAAGEGWRCTRCGQQWDARRLATVAAYAAWVLARAPEVPIGSASSR